MTATLSTVATLATTVTPVPDTTAPTAPPPPASTSSLLHCWRTSTLPPSLPHHALLLAGCGYSATGFFSSILTAAGFPLGHEKLATHGTSCWQCASQHADAYSKLLYDDPKFRPEAFKHVFMLVRHPLKIVR